MIHIRNDEINKWGRKWHEERKVAIETMCKEVLFSAMRAYSAMSTESKRSADVHSDFVRELRDQWTSKDVWRNPYHVEKDQEEALARYEADAYARLQDETPGWEFYCLQDVIAIGILHDELLPKTRQVILWYRIAPWLVASIVGAAGLGVALLRMFD